MTYFFIVDGSLRLLLDWLLSSAAKAKLFHPAGFSQRECGLLMNEHKGSVIMSANSLSPTSVHYLLHSIRIAKKLPQQTSDDTTSKAIPGYGSKQLARVNLESARIASGGGQALSWEEIGSDRVIITDLSPSTLSFIADYYLEPRQDQLCIQLRIWGEAIELKGEVSTCIPMKGLYLYELILTEACTFKRQLRDLLAKVMTYYEDDPRYPAFHEWVLQLITGKHPDETERNYGRT